MAVNPATVGVKPSVQTMEHPVQLPGGVMPGSEVVPSQNDDGLDKFPVGIGYTVTM